jgi:thiamine kinase-like enzyme
VTVDWRHLLPGWRPGSVLLECCELGQGSGGEVWRVSTAQGRWVVKQHLHEDSAVDLRRMQELQNLAAQHGLAPRIVAIDLRSGSEVAQWLQGVVAAAAEFEKPDYLQRVAQRLGELHRIPVPPGWAARDDWRFDILRHVQSRWSRLQARAAAADISPLAVRVQEAAAQFAVTQNRQRPLALLHLDAHAGNLLAGDDLVLLDWEYASLGDPLWDLASWLAPLPVTERQGLQLIQAAGRAGDTSWQELRAARALFTLLNELWRLERLPAARAG